MLLIINTKIYILRCVCVCVCSYIYSVIFVKLLFYIVETSTHTHSLCVCLCDSLWTLNCPLIKLTSCSQVSFQQSTKIHQIFTLTHKLQIKNNLLLLFCFIKTTLFACCFFNCREHSPPRLSDRTSLII